MEAIAYYSSSDQPFSPSNNYARNFNKTIHGHFVTTNYQKGILQAPSPAFLYHSFPPFSSSAHHHHQQVQQQPPLLPLPFPLPISKSAQHNNHNNLNRGLSCPPINGRVNNIDRTKDSFLVPKKSKKKQSPKSSNVKGITNTNPLGPHPNDLPKDVSSKVVSLSSNGRLVNSTVVSSKSIENNLHVDKFSGSVVFTISPPPSSLPLPTFSLRPKLSCKSEVDAGATDNLRRLLRL